MSKYVPARMVGRCHDCGAPTPNYRCGKCKKKHLEAHGINPQGAGVDEAAAHVSAGGFHGKSHRSNCIDSGETS